MQFELTTLQAFESPLLADCNSNCSGRDMAMKMNELELQYGVVAYDDQATGDAKLAFADPKVVEKPRSGMLINI